MWPFVSGFLHHVFTYFTYYHRVICRWPSQDSNSRPTTSGARLFTTAPDSTQGDFMRCAGETVTSPVQVRSL